MNLQPGSRGPAVEQLQRALVRLGHMTSAEMATGPGVFGPRTKAAVQEFQAKHGVPTTGNYGPLTREAMKAAIERLDAPRPAPRPSEVKAPQVNLQRGDRGSNVEMLQKALVKLGYMSKETMATGPGIFGPATQASVQKLQGDWNVPQTGNYGPQTRAALEKALRGEKPPRTEPRPTPGPVNKPPVVNAPSPNQNSRGGVDIDAIVLHHTGSNNGAGDLAHMRNPRSKVSAHYMIDRDGTIYQLVPDGQRAWHAGTAHLHGDRSDVNSRSLGIEIVNDGGGRTPYTEAQYRALEKLVPYLAKTYKVPLANLVGHKDVALPKGRKSDPSANFDFNRIRQAMARVVS